MAEPAGSQVDLAEEIADAAQSPAEASSGSVRAKARTIGELIEADKHLTGRQAALNPARALFRVKLLPGGSV